MFRQGRQHRQDDGADEPEPARHQSAPPEPLIGAHVLDQADGRGGNVRIDLQIRRAFAGARNEQARDPGSGCRDQHQPREMERIAAIAGRKPGDDSADQNGDERSAFDQRVALGQFFALQMIGQDAVFDRAEQCCNHAVEKDGEKQHGDRMKREADHRQHGDGDLEQLQSARHNGFVETVGDLAANAGQKEERECQRRGCELDQGAGLGLAEPEQQHKDQRLLEEVVAERRESLAPEQRRKTSRRHQGRRHGSPAVRFPFSRPDFRRPAKNWRCGFGREREPRGTDWTTDFAFAISEIMALRPEPAAAMAFSACPLAAWAAAPPRAGECGRAPIAARMASAPGRPRTDWPRR